MPCYLIEPSADLPFLRSLLATVGNQPRILPSAATITIYGTPVDCMYVHQTRPALFPTFRSRRISRQRALVLHYWRMLGNPFFCFPLCQVVQSSGKRYDPKRIEKKKKGRSSSPCQGQPVTVILSQQVPAMGTRRRRHVRYEHPQRTVSLMIFNDLSKISLPY